MFKTELPPKVTRMMPRTNFPKTGGETRVGLAPPPPPQISEINLRRFRHASPPPSSLGQTEERVGDGRTV